MFQIITITDDVKMDTVHPKKIAPRLGTMSQLIEKSETFE